MIPETIEEWANYIETLSGEQLRSKAIAANSYRFVQSLLSEGYNAEQIHAIFVLFAQRFVATEQMAPSEGYINYQNLVP